MFSVHSTALSDSLGLLSLVTNPGEISRVKVSFTVGPMFADKLYLNYIRTSVV